MGLMRVWIISLLIVASTAIVRGQESARVEEIAALVSAGEYREALSRINKELAGSLADQPGRYEMLMLKGECQLQLKDRIGAGSAFKSAAKSAQDAGQLAAARAHALIVERSTNGSYKPAAGSGREPIDIMLIDPRKEAMTLLQEELWSKCKSQVESALRAETLAPIEQVFTRVADVYCLELFATGQGGQSESVMRELGGHAFELMQRDVGKAAGRVDYLSQVANSSSDLRRGWSSGRMGLTSQQRDEVKAMLPYLQQIGQRATEYRRIAAKLGGDPAKWDALVANTMDAINEAEFLYNDR